MSLDSTTTNPEPKRKQMFHYTFTYLLNKTINLQIKSYKKTHISQAQNNALHLLTFSDHQAKDKNKREIKAGEKKSAFMKPQPAWSEFFTGTVT